MKTPNAIFLVLSLLLVGAACRPVVDAEGAIHAAQASDEVNYENLYEREADWPYQIQLTGDWKPEGWVGRFGFGLGVLVRVEPSGALRVDFGQLGKYVVPARETDVIAKANAIRTGQNTKSRANFVVAVGTRLLDPTTDRPRPVGELRTGEARAFLVVFADPDSPDFHEIAQEISGDRHPTLESQGIMPVLFAQGGRHDGGVVHACRTNGWAAPFLFERFTVPLTDSILGAAPTSPHVMLLSPEGRLIFSRDWKPGVLDDLGEAIPKPAAAMTSTNISDRRDVHFVSIS